MDANINHNWEETTKTLKHWRKRCKKLENEASKATNKYRKYNYFIGVPVVIFSSLASSAAFSALLSDDATGSFFQEYKFPIRLIAGLVSLFAAILAGLQTFFRFGELAEKCRNVAVGFEELQIEIDEIINYEPPRDTKKRLDEIRKKMNSLIEKMPFSTVS